MHQFEALWDKYDAAALVCVDGVDNTDDVGCCRDDQGADNGVDEIGGNRVDCKEDEKKKNDGKEEEEGGDAMSTSVHVTSRSVSSGGGHIDGKMIRGWNDKVFRDDNLLRLVRMRRQGQGQGQRQGQGQGQGQRQGQGQGQGPGQGQGKVSSGTGDGSGTIDIGSNDRRNDVDGGGGVSSSSSGVMYVSSSASGSGGSYFRCLHTEAEITSLVHQAWQRLPSSSSSMRVEEDYRSEAIRLAKQVQNTYIHKLSYIRSLTHSLPPSLAQPLFHTLHNTPP